MSNRFAVFGLTAGVLLLGLAISPSLKATTGASRAPAQAQSAGGPPSPDERSLIRATPFHGDLRHLRRVPPRKRERPEREAPVQDLPGELVPIGSGLAAPSSPTSRSSSTPLRMSSIRPEPTSALRLPRVAIRSAAVGTSTR